MQVSRRSFVKTTGIGMTAAAIMAWDGPRSIARAWAMSLPQSERPMLLHNNENPLGPGAKVIASMNRGLENGRGGRYPGGVDVGGTIARVQEIPSENVMLGNGSTQLLRTCTHVWTSPTKALVTASPTFEECTDYAKNIGHAVEEIGLDENLALDLDEMAAAAKGAGMVFLNNPNNPTATLHSEDAVGAFIERVRSESPDTIIMVDEAYHEYVTDRNHKTQIPRALEDKNVIVTRTFSKAYGMAGMRVGWMVAHPDRIGELRRWHYGLSMNIPALMGAVAAMEDQDRMDQEKARNTAARQYTMDWFTGHGMKVTDSQCNFIFVNTGMNAGEFRDKCAAHNIAVGRDFPPYQDGWARISISTMDDMRKATQVFGQVLGVPEAEAA